MDELKYLKKRDIPYSYGKNRIFARPVVNGCKGCCFNNEGEGAKRCDMKRSRMAHFRPDRTSVIFIVK